MTRRTTTTERRGGLCGCSGSSERPSPWAWWLSWLPAPVSGAAGAELCSRSGAAVCRLLVSPGGRLPHGSSRRDHVLAQAPGLDHTPRADPDEAIGHITDSRGHVSCADAEPDAHGRSPAAASPR